MNIKIPNGTKNPYVSLIPETLEIVDRFYGDESDVESRSPNLEHVIVPPDLDISFVIPKRNLETNKIEFTLDAEALEAERQNYIQSQWIMFRSERKRLLEECDWVVLPDVNITQEKLDEWKLYRQALRDLPLTTVDPQNPVYPTPPS